MALNFPASPSTGDVHNASNGLQYHFDGVKWVSQGAYNTSTINTLNFTQQGTGAVSRSVQNKLEDVVSVKDFGAKGDGTTDDTAAIHAALTASKCVFLPAGTYIVTGITFKQVGQALIGESNKSSILKLKENSNTFVLDTNEFSQIRIENLLLDGNRDNNTGSKGLKVNYSYYVTIKDVDIRFTDDYLLHGCHSFDVLALNLRCSHTDCNSNNKAIFLDVNTKHWTFINGGVENIKSGNTFAIYSQGKHCIFRNMWIEWYPADNVTGNETGIYANNVSNQVEFCTIKSTDTTGLGKGIHFAGSSLFCQAFNNEIATNTTQPIFLEGNLQSRNIKELSTSVTNNDADKTTLIGYGSNLDATDLRVKSVRVSTNSSYTPTGEFNISTNAPVFHANCENGNSGLRVNVTGTDSNSDNLFRIQNNGATKIEVDHFGHLFAGTNDSQDLGTPAKKWDDIHATNSTIQTSDQNLKQDIQSLTTAEKTVATTLKTLIKTFKYKSAVKLKGDNARIHCGVIAQEVKQAFETQGLDPSKYALFCYDEWDEAKDENGNVVTTAGSGYSIRYTELLAFIISAL